MTQPTGQGGCPEEPQKIRKGKINEDIKGICKDGIRGNGKGNWQEVRLFYSGL
jgi:hypothetical protein